MPGVEPLKLAPIFKERVWGGRRLVPDSAVPIGEAWIVFEDSVVIAGGWAGRTLGDATAVLGADLLGDNVQGETGLRFPLLVKLLDSSDWLSVQVHPNDEQARSFEGPEHFGKTEAWHVLEADPDAQVVYGHKRGIDHAELDQLVRTGALETALNFRQVQAGDTLFTPAGCVHAIGPGLFIYEVQQTSDITYRLYDWNRPQSAGRELHLEKGLDVVGDCSSEDSDRVSSGPSLVECPYFALDRVSTSSVMTLNTEHRSFHAVTVTDGSAYISAGEWSVPVLELESVVVPASTGTYDVVPEAMCTLLISRVP